MTNTDELTSKDAILEVHILIHIHYCLKCKLVHCFSTAKCFLFLIKHDNSCLSVSYRFELCDCYHIVKSKTFTTYAWPYNTVRQVFLLLRVETPETIGNVYKLCLCI